MREEEKKYTQEPWDENEFQISYGNFLVSLHDDNLRWWTMGMMIRRWRKKILDKQFSSSFFASSLIEIDNVSLLLY